MSETNFVDYVKIYCRSGKGGRGSSHFRREKYIPKGGPDGGDGGNGGSIYIQANQNYWTLLHLRFNRHIYAPSGESGSGALKTGSSGKDIIIEVPIGTSVYDAQSGDFILDVTQHNQKKLLLSGGRGGKGNTFFKTSTNQAPRYSQPGEPAQEKEIILQLKTLADVGLVGFPNAGKSTLLSSITSAKPKIADYPFTTLVPNLGIVGYRDNKSFVIADIPGIIEGASEGKGLGLRFLRHIERNSILLFMVPIDSDNICKEYEILLQEVLKYNPGLGQKRRILAITKCDLADEEIIEMISSEVPKSIPCVFISSVAQKGLLELKDLLWKELNRDMPYDNSELVRQAMAVESLHDDDTDYNSQEVENTEDDDDELLDIEWDQEIQDNIGL